MLADEAEIGYMRNVREDYVHDRTGEKERNEKLESVGGKGAGDAGRWAIP